MSKKKSRKKGNDEKKLFAFLATFLSIVGFVIALIAKRNDKYVMFYAKQSIGVFIIYVLAWAIGTLPVIGDIVGPIVYFATIVFWVFSWAYALSGKQREVPFIGKYSKKIDL